MPLRPDPFDLHDPPSGGSLPSGVMAPTLQTINIGSTVDDDAGDPVRTAFAKVNANEAALATAINALSAGLAAVSSSTAPVSSLSTLVQNVAGVIVTVLADGQFAINQADGTLQTRRSNGSIRTTPLDLGTAATADLVDVLSAASSAGATAGTTVVASAVPNALATTLIDVPTATIPEAVAGTRDDVAMTPLGVAAAIGPAIAHFLASLPTSPDGLAPGSLFRAGDLLAFVPQP